MKHLLLLFLLFSSSTFAQPLADEDRNKLNTIAELFKKGDRAEAISQLQLNDDSLSKAVTETEDANTLFQLGMLYFWAEMDAKSLDSFAKALQYDASFAELHYYTGQIHAYAQNYDAAEQALNQAIELNNNDDRYFGLLGTVLNRKNDAKGALDAHLNALEINENNFNSNSASASLYIGLKDYINAEKYFLAANKLQPDDIDVNYNLGLMYKQTQQPTLALKYFSKVVQLDPSDAQALINVIQANQTLGKTDDRNHAVSKIYQLWRGSKPDSYLAKSGLFVREESHLDIGELVGIEYFAWDGDPLKKLALRLLDPDTAELQLRLVLYKASSEAKQVFYLDGYPSSGERDRYAYYDLEPDYDTVRNLAHKIFSGEHKAIELIEESFFAGGDGLSYEQAVMFPNAKSSADGVPMESRWLKIKYPSYKKDEQGIAFHDGKIYDRIHITTSSGEEKQIYFEMTSWYGFSGIE
jgi:tetratricopeptide (TPR) repeat protein